MIPAHLDRMYVWVPPDPSAWGEHPGEWGIAPSPILLKKVVFWDPVDTSFEYVVWTPEDDRPYSDKEVNAMRLHCESHRVNFQLKLPGRGLPWNL